MKKSLLFLCVFLYAVTLRAQTSLEQLKSKMAAMPEDTVKVNSCIQISKKYLRSNLDSAVTYGLKALLLAERVKDREAIFRSNDIYGYALLKKGNIPKAKAILLKAYAMGKSLPLTDQYFYNIFHIFSMYMMSKNSDSALFYANVSYNRALTYPKKAIECNCYTNYGEYYRSFSDYDKSIDNFYKALKCNENNGSIDDDLEFTSFIGIGNINYSTGKYKTAIEFYEKALAGKFAKSSAGEAELSVLYNNLGASYYTIGGTTNDSALKTKGIEYFKKVLEQNIKSGNRVSMGRMYGNLGSVYANEGKYELAKPYFENALAIAVESNNRQSEAKNSNNLGDLYGKLNDSLKAIEYYNRSVSIAKAAKSKEQLILNYENLNMFYAERKNYALAYEYLQLLINQKDSLLNEQNQSKLATLKTQYDTEKKDQQIQLLAKDKLVKELFIDKQEGELLKQRSEAQQQSYKIKILNDQKRLDQVMLANEKIEKEKKLRENELLTQQNQLSQKTLQQQKVITLLIALGLIATLIAIVLVFKQYRQKQKANEIITAQKQEVEIQKEIIEVKNKEIVDSIQYAKRIQNALFASDAFLSKHLKEHFVVYKPKDIVSGDFYWASNTGNKFYLCTADCTGHGVPGAFMSLLGLSFLNEITSAKKISAPHLIFDELRKDIIHALNPEGVEVEGKDGMDAVLCEYDFQTNMLRFAAANNPLWLIREGQLLEFKPDKQPIGKYFDENNAYTLHEIQLQKGDAIYTFTDGYADQFGGQKGKKFKYAQLKTTLLECVHLPMSEQKILLEHKFQQWRGNLEQVDDILLIGVRV